MRQPLKLRLPVGRTRASSARSISCSLRRCAEPFRPRVCALPGGGLDANHLCFVFYVLLPAAAAAQPRAFAVWERPAAGVILGPSANGGDDSEDAAAEIGFVFDTPVVFGYRVRADVSRVSAGALTFTNEASPFRPVETVTVKSIRLSVLGVRHAGARIAGYAGGGYGAYRYEYDRPAAAQSLARRFPTAWPASRSSAGTSATLAAARCASTSSTARGQPPVSRLGAAQARWRARE